MNSCQVDNCSQMSLIFSCHCLMDTNVSVDDEENVMPKSAFNKLTVLVLAVSRCGQESSIGDRMALIHVADEMIVIKCREDGLQHHVILHMKVSGGMFQHD